MSNVEFDSDQFQAPNRYSKVGSSGSFDSGPKNTKRNQAIMLVVALLAIAITAIILLRQYALSPASNALSPVEIQNKPQFLPK